jgi:MFS family permease
MGNRLNFGFLTQDIKISSRKFVAVTILSSGTLAWFFLIQVYLGEAFKNFAYNSFWPSIATILFYGFSAFSAIIGSLVGERVNRRKLLWAWMILGVLTTASLTVFSGVIFLAFSSILLGVSFGFGLPSCAALLADRTVVEERARVSGTIWLETFLMASLAISVISFLKFGITEVILLCIILRSTSFLALFLDPCDRATGRKKSWRRVLKYKQFAFYLFPWIMFNIAAGLAWWVIPPSIYSSAIITGTSIRYVCAAIFGFISGVAADRVGRKQPIIIGLVILGISFALLSLGPSTFSVLVYLTTSGIAWGILSVVYVAVSGDLSFPGSKEKFYALGTVAPLIIWISLANTPSLLRISDPVSALSPVLSIILFVSVIPVLYASETLPEGKMHARKLNEYLRKMGKRVEENKKPDSSSL